MSRLWKNVKKLLIHRVYLPAVFLFARFRRRDQNKIVLVSDRHPALEPNLAAIKRELDACGYTTVAYVNFQQGLLNRLRDYTRFTIDYAACGAVLLEDYFLPAYANRPRRGTQLIQLWHACGAFKKWGYSCIGKTWGMSAGEARLSRAHRGYTGAITSSEAIREKYAEAYHCDISIIHPTGIPRTDEFFDPSFQQSARSKFFSLHPEMKGKKLVLYAPTFRGADADLAHNDKNAFDLPLLHERLGDHYGLVLKLHPFVSEAVEIPASCTGFACDVSSEMQINEMLSLADICVSDYSSLIFEFSLMDRPMVFYAYDLQAYIAERDFYYDYASMVPGRIAETCEELAAYILSADADFDRELMAAFRKKFMGACDGCSTERFMQQFFPN